MEYPGKCFKLYKEEPAVEDMEDPKNLYLLSGFLLTKYCDKIKASEKNGKTTVRMSFEH